MSSRWALLLLAGWWLLLSGPLLWGPGNLFAGDTGWLDVPNRLHAASMLRDGVFPGWTSQLLTGFPLHAEGQAGILYPGFLIYLISPTATAHDLFVASHLALGGTFMCLFLFRHCRSLLPAVLGGMLWIREITLTLPGTLVTLTWLPLATWCILRWAEGERKAVWWCAAVNGLILLAGCPNTALMCLTIEAILIVAMSWGNLRSAGVVRAVMVVLVFPSALAAAQLFPTVVYFADSNRVGADVSGFFGETGLPALRVAWLLGWSVPATLWIRPRRRPIAWLVLAVSGALLSVGSPLLKAVQLLPFYSWFRWPHEYYWLTSFSACALVALGVEGVARRWPPRKAAFWRWGAGPVAAAFFLMLVLKNHALYRSHLATTGFYSLEVPAVLEPKGRAHSRLLQMRSAYHGVQELAGGIYSPLLETVMMRNRSYLPANYNLLHGVAGADLISLQETVSPRQISEIWSVLQEALHPKLLRVAAITHLAGPEPLWLYRSASMAGDGWRFKSQDVGARVDAVPSELGVMRVEIDRFTQAEKWKIQLQRLFLPLRGESIYSVSFRARAENARTIGVGLSRTYAPWHSVGLYREVDLTTEWQDFELEALIETDEPNGRLHFDVGGDSADVEIDKVEVRGPDGGTVGMHVPSWGESLELVADAPAWIYRMRDPPPRAWMVYDAILLPDSGERLSMLVDSRFDPARQAITESRVELGERPGQAPRVTTREPRADRLEVEVETGSRGLLVVADLYDRGFVATLDGREAELLRVNHAFRGIVVPAGRHLVEMAYRPLELYLGVVVSLVSWVFVAFASVRRT